MTDERARRYAQLEQVNEQRKAATVRRGPVSLIAVVLLLVLVVAVTAVLDLRRLETPAGTAQSWAGASVFGDCTTFRRLSVDAPEGDAACRDLRAAGARARERPDQVVLEVVSAEEQDDRARATLRLVLPGSRERQVELDLRRVGGDWKVELTDAACAAVPCP